MRRYAKTDLQGLVASGCWRDPRSASRTLTSRRARNGQALRCCQHHVEKSWKGRLKWHKPLIALTPGQLSTKAGRNFLGWCWCNFSRPGELRLAEFVCSMRVLFTGEIP
jgi:hypothetical protein